MDMKVLEMEGGPGKAPMVLITVKSKYWHKKKFKMLLGLIHNSMKNNHQCILYLCSIHTTDSTSQPRETVPLNSIWDLLILGNCGFRGVLPEGD
jgi:hypothetical protein